ncbi:MAG TPA: bifunctional molybdopterin-guanine dinucleotide biosynthesis adaptor protein MobB/molybdopterin molybdotransferase MoeA [Chromatiales bacterium]|nr:bifunctional molybdopterin-guanine dinucleotide biosynthesis adaptor protein MobB/molybdopterin molybdotransferase MoeA [Thiotrichales bacterium]HIP69200.1 bifunctional molybdopterin-guanine dinucleotide biosynthesis adaptor protein MobB/molybdopterin molybdotransferase MoeA [Chromatiales bacterium]
MSVERQSSCADDFDPGSLPVETAREKILQAIQPVAQNETVPLQNAIGRVLAEAIISPVNVPSHTNSAMDGYAVRGADLPEEGEVKLDMIGTAFAGHPFSAEMGAGECVRIMTGAAMPSGADTVIMQEHVTAEGDQVTIGSGQRAGQHVRQAGEDIKKGDAVLQPGKLLQAADLGLIASLGIGEMQVTRRLKVAFFSTGDELCSIGESLGEGQIYDSNRYTLHGMLQQFGVEIIDLGVVPDDREKLRQTLLTSAEQADVVITSGGVSVGEADYIKDLLEELGQVNFWKIAMKPGRPLTFGRLGAAWFFGLPGNPVSVMVTFLQFVQPALQKLSGMRVKRPLQLQLPCQSRLKKQPGRIEYQRAIMRQGEDGQWYVETTGGQGSGILHSMSLANCFIVLPEDSTGAEIGELVTVEPFCYLT